MPSKQDADDHLTAATDLLGRLGAESMELRYSEPDKGMESPIVWIAIAEFPRYGAPSQVAAGLHPVHALEKLLEQLVDGGTCQHCKRPTALLTDLDDAGLLGEITCTYQYDPELKTYRRSCEGET